MNFKVMIHHDEIRKRVVDLATEVSEYYAKMNTQRLLVIGVLKGSFVFLSDLVRELKVPCEIDFLEATSYGAGTVSSGEVKLLRDVSLPLKGRDVLIVEDIVDTGYTMSYLVKHLKSHAPRSVTVCSFLDKPSRRRVKLDADFVGFTIEDHFVVGYGLDYNNCYRELKSVVIFEPGGPAEEDEAGK